MKETAPFVKFVLDLTRSQAILARRLDKGLGGIGLNEFLIMYHIGQDKEQRMRRVDLAAKVGLTPSGVTRLLLPMEKIGLVKSGPSQEDARERFVHLAPGGRTKLNEALERLEILAESIAPADQGKRLKDCSELLAEIGGRTLMS